MSEGVAGVVQTLSGALACRGDNRKLNMSHPQPSKEEVLACADRLSPELGAYLRNKLRGGSSGRKGADFERLFAAYTLAGEARKALASGLPLDDPTPWPHFHEQAVAFVDDLLVESDGAHHFYQLKSVAKLSWAAGEHPVAEDFRCQARLSAALRQPPIKTTLVVSDSSLREALERAMPEDVACHSAVDYFPSCTSTNRLVWEFAPLRQAVQGVLSRPHAKCDDIESALLALCSALQASGGRRSALDLLRAAHNNCTLIVAPPVAAAPLLAGFDEALARIDGFTYSLDGGAFTWRCNDDEGVLPYSLETPQFDDFQRNVLDTCPRTFDELEPLLT